MSNMQKHAVLSLSGGMDSSSLLLELLASDEYEQIHCFAFDYGQRHRHELDSVSQLIQYLKCMYDININFKLIDLKDVFSDSQSALRDTNVDVPKEAYNDVNITATVVENRNVIFSSIIYSKALSISKKFNVDVDIALGVHNNDESVYLDCRPESVELSKQLYRISNYGSERITYITPFIDLTKTDVLHRGLMAGTQLGIDLDEYYLLTSSCYDPVYNPKAECYIDRALACGRCATCLDRLKAFKENKMKDPIQYV